MKPEHDKIAAYGIGSLIAGKVALKIGCSAKLGLVFRVKFLKPIPDRCLAVLGGAIAKIFTGRKKDDAPARARAGGRSSRAVDAGSPTLIFAMQS